MITSDQIKIWLEKADITNTVVMFNTVGKPDSLMKRLLLELKVRIDRWDLITQAFIFNDDVRNLVGEFLIDKNVKQDGSWNIWGADLIFSKDIPGDKVLALSFEGEKLGTKDYRYLALGKLPSEMSKYLNMKAFW